MPRNAILNIKDEVERLFVWVKIVSHVCLAKISDVFFRRWTGVVINL